jgi:uncharacterized protein YyaL (SSP411 family)
MAMPDGGFASALDADTEGVEGLTYVWTVEELRATLGADAPAAIAWLGATEDGNFHEGPPGASVLESRGPEPEPAARDRIRVALLAARDRRPQPARDDKRVTSWNALMVAALADAGAVLRRPGYVDAAVSTAAFLLDRLRAPDGRLLRTFNAGRAKIGAGLEDHAFLLEALLVLYEATFDERWFREALALAGELVERFGDPERGGFFSTAADAALIARRKDLEDAPIPAGGSSAALGLLRLAALTGDAELERRATGQLRLLHEIAPRHPSAFGHLLQALDLYVHPAREVALVGPEHGRRALAGVVRETLRPRVVLAGGPGEGPTAVPLLEGRTPVDGAAAAYVCERFACLRPVTDAGDLRALLA